MFANLSEPLIQSILECFEYMCVPADEYVYRKSEMGSNMYIILEGWVSLGHSGHEPALMGPGSFFGEEAILNKIGLRDTSVRTHTGDQACHSPPITVI
jgi:CRP-like cAMP-binding protein